jgi:hypothetical protein
MLREYMKQYKHELVTCERPLGGGVPISQIKVHCCSSLHAPTGPATPLRPAVAAKISYGLSQ